jgi:hypothetical protein
VKRFECVVNFVTALLKPRCLLRDNAQSLLSVLARDGDVSTNVK